MATNLAEQNTSLIKRYPVAAYYLLALAFSWSIQLPLGAVKQGWIDLPMPFATHYLAAFGPMLAALIVTAATSGSEGLKELWGRVTLWRVGWKWALICILPPAVVFAASLPIVRLVKGEWPDLRLLGQANYLPYLGIGVVIIWLATYGFVEEIGWRGFALPLAAGVLAALGILLSPAVGAVLMSLSTVIVAINAQLLRRIEIGREA